MEALTILPEVVSGEIEGLIRQEVDDLRREGAILGLSGGIDSAVVAALAARALGPDNVLALMMPELDSAPESLHLARGLARQLRIRHKVIGLTKVLALLGAYGALPLWLLGPRRLRARVVKNYYQGFSNELGEKESPFSAILSGTKGLKNPWINRAVAYHRLKVRLRMLVLYYYAELNNLLVLGTCNKTELMLGFFVKYGDAAADVAPIEHLYKTQVRHLAAFLSTPQEIIDRAPSPDLLPGITDEYALGVDYRTLDGILWRMERGVSREKIALQLGVQPDQVAYVGKLYRRSEHMRHPLVVLQDTL